MTEFELTDIPSDGIAALSFSPDASKPLLAVGSWDKSVSIVDAQQNLKIGLHSHSAAVLDVCFDRTCVYSGGLDRRVVRYDCSNMQTVTVGTHDDAVRCLELTQDGLLVTGSWDKTVKLWDTRHNKDITLLQPHRVFAMSTIGNKIVVCLAQRVIQIYDVRQLKEPFEQRESSLKYMTRQVCCMPDGQGYCLSSIEGRVSLEYFDSSEDVQAKKYAFKCHRQTIDGIDTVYPVNALVYHPCGTFASGGGDGIVNIWDGTNKKRIKQFPRYPTSISALAFNSTGSLLAIEASYTYEAGERDHPPESIYIRSIADSDVRPKIKNQ